MKNRSPRMLVSALTLLAVSAAVAQTAPAQAAVQGPHAASCEAGASVPAVLLTVTGFKDHVGQVRVKVFRGVEDEFLKSGKSLVKFDVPVPASGDVEVCVPLPGNHPVYAISVLHDRDMDGKTDLWSDGFGVSNNPKLKMAKPPVKQVAFKAPQSVGAMKIVLNYVSGLSVKPIREAK